MDAATSEGGSGSDLPNEEAVPSKSSKAGSKDEPCNCDNSEAWFRIDNPSSAGKYCLRVDEGGTCFADCTLVTPDFLGDPDLSCEAGPFDSIEACEATIADEDLLTPVDQCGEPDIPPPSPTPPATPPSGFESLKPTPGSSEGSTPTVGKEAGDGCDN